MAHIHLASWKDLLFAKSFSRGTWHKSGRGEKKKKKEERRKKSNMDNKQCMHNLITHCYPVHHATLVDEREEMGHVIQWRDDDLLAGLQVIWGNITMDATFTRDYHRRPIGAIPWQNARAGLAPPQEIEDEDDEQD